MSKRKNVNDWGRAAVIRHLLAGSKSGALKRGAFKAAAEEFDCEWQSIKRLWRRYDAQHQSGVAHPDLSSNRKKNSGRKNIPIEEPRARLTDVPLSARTTLGGGGRPVHMAS